MNKNSSVIYSILNAATTENCFKNNLSFIEKSLLLQRNNETPQSDIISSINNKLHGNENERWKALQILDKYLLQCPSDVFSSNAILWMQHSIKWVQRTTVLELKVLNKLITMSAGNPDLKKQISATILPKFVERLNSCKKTSTRVCILKLQCLKSFVEGFASCGQFKNQLNKYVLYVLKRFAENENVILQAAKCYVSLYCCGGKGYQGVNYQEKWAEQYNCLISTINKLLDDLYSGIDTIGLSERDDAKIITDLLELKDDNFTSNTVTRYYRMKINFRVLSCIMKSMLSCKFPVNKAGHPEDLLNLICRVLSVTCNTLEEADSTNDVIALYMNILDIHGYTFDMLKALILCAGNNLIQYGTYICKLCIQSLKWTSSETTTDTLKPFQSIRKKAYETLRAWLSVAESSSSIETFADEIIPIIIADIEYRKPSVTLVTDNQKRKNKRKRPQYSMEVNIPSETVSSLDKQANKIVCSWAHETLHLILTNASIFIKWEHHKNLQILVVNQLLDVLKAGRVSEYPIPYSDTKCRLMLYKSLFLLVTEPHPKWFAPISHASNIFNLGLQDLNIDVSNFCKDAINVIEIIDHPKAPTLNVQIEVAKTMTTFKESSFMDATLPLSSFQVEDKSSAKKVAEFFNPKNADIDVDEMVQNRETRTENVDKTIDVAEEKKNVETEIVSPKKNDIETSNEPLLPENDANDKSPPKKKLKCDKDDGEEMDPDVQAMLEDFVDIIN